jgi:hypothetical protein
LAPRCCSGAARGFPIGSDAPFWGVGGNPLGERANPMAAAVNRIIADANPIADAPPIGAATSPRIAGDRDRIAARPFSAAAAPEKCVET